ncbi:predicted protein [Postia placenta Mad-698-R]|nr:predicted protein [Postia placenta Mad-698-R]
MQSGKTNREALLLELKAQDADPLNSPLLNVSTIARGELREQDTELLEALPLIWERSDRLDTLEIDVGNATALAVDYLVHLRQLPVWTLRNLRIVGPRNGPDRRPALGILDDGAQVLRAARFLGCGLPLSTAVKYNTLERLLITHTMITLSAFVPRGFGHLTYLLLAGRIVPETPKVQRLTFPALQELVLHLAKNTADVLGAIDAPEPSRLQIVDMNVFDANDLQCFVKALTSSQKKSRKVYALWLDIRYDKNVAGRSNSDSSEWQAQPDEFRKFLTFLPELQKLVICGPNADDCAPYFAPRNEYSNSSGSIVSKLRSLTFLHSSKASMKTRTRLSGLHEGVCPTQRLFHRSELGEGAICLTRPDQQKRWKPERWSWRAICPIGQQMKNVRADKSHSSKPKTESDRISIAKVASFEALSTMMMLRSESPGLGQGNVARGLKAAISNPNNSEEAKERASERLQELQDAGHLDSREAHDANVAIGHKAAISNPNISEEAKEHSAQVLEDMDQE